jgi:hypothetical protein
MPVMFLANVSVSFHSRRKIHHGRAHVDVKALLEEGTAGCADGQMLIFVQSEDEEIASAILRLPFNIAPGDMEEAYLPGKGEVGLPADTDWDDDDGRTYFEKGPGEIPP